MKKEKKVGRGREGKRGKWQKSGQRNRDGDDKGSGGWKKGKGDKDGQRNRQLLNQKYKKGKPFKKEFAKAKPSLIMSNLNSLGNRQHHNQGPSNRQNSMQAMTHHDVRHQAKQYQKKMENLKKLMITEQLKKPIVNIQLVKEWLKDIKSRGAKQRINKRLAAITQ